MKYNITLKNIQFSGFMTQETHCFNATVYINGKRSFFAQNDGHGGCNDYYPLNEGSPKETRELVEKIELEQSKIKHEFMGKMLGSDLDSVCCDLVNAWLEDKDVKKILKKITYIKNDNDGFYQISGKIKPNTGNYSRVRAVEWFKDNWTILNELPFNEAKKHLIPQ